MKVHLADDYAAPTCGSRHGRTTSDPGDNAYRRVA